MTGEKKTDGIENQVDYEESNTVAGTRSGQADQLSRQASAPPQRPTQTLLDPLAQQALDEFAQIAHELPVVTLGVPQVSLQAACDGGDWCLPPVSCSASSTMSSEAQAALYENQEACKPVVIG